MLSLRAAELTLGGRVLWSGLDLDIAPGEFVAVLGANGSGKTSLLKAVLGEPVRHGDRRIGYVPQQRLADEGTPLRGRDLVGLGVDGHRWGIAWPTQERRRKIARLLAAVGAESFANTPVASLSGGQQQRLRIGQAFADEPALLLFDEPLQSLDLRAQGDISRLIDDHRRERGFGVLFVTHDINPVLEMVDRVLYLAGRSFRIGTPDEVLRSEVLSELYQSPVDVIRARGRVVIVGAPDETHAHGRDHDHAGDLP